MLYKKRDLGQLSESDRTEIKSRKAKLENLKKSKTKLQQGQQRSQKLREGRKQKLLALDPEARQRLIIIILTGKTYW